MASPTRLSGPRLAEIHETGAYVVGLFDWEDKNSSVADLAGSGRFADDLHDIVHLVIVDRDFDHDFGKQRQVVFDSAINGLVPALAPMAADLRHCHSRNEGDELFDDLSESFLADDALNQFHSASIA